MAKWTYSKVKERIKHEEEGSRGAYIKKPDTLEWFTIKEARPHLLDVIPYILKADTPFAPAGALHYELTFYLHGNIGEMNERVVCPWRTYGQRCPICQYISELRKSPNADDDAIKSLTARRKQLFLVIDLEDVDRGLQLWEMSYGNFGEQLKDYLKDVDEDSRYDEFFYLDDGFAMRVGFKREAFQGRPYFKASSIEFRPRKRQYAGKVGEKLMKQVPCLDDLLVVLDYETLEKKFLEDEPASVDPEGDEPAANGDGKRKSKAFWKDEDDEDESPEAAEEAAEAEVEETKEVAAKKTTTKKKTSTKKSSAKKVQPKPEPEPEPEEEADEEDGPWEEVDKEEPTSKEGDWDDDEDDEDDWEDGDEDWYEGGDDEEE